MKDGIGLKRQLVERINEILDNRIVESKKGLEEARESRDKETKSSVGDKYETGRAMVQIEMGKHQDQLNNFVRLKKAISQIDVLHEADQVRFGSLVITSQGNYFLSVGLGVIEMETNKYFAISLAAPIGRVLENRKAGEKFIFQGKEIEILQIY